MTGSNYGKWMALTAALLGWLFDGLEMGLFPLVARPALGELVSEAHVSSWLGIINALFLIGAATGGVLFGWIGDRFGRVKSMMLSVLTYALVSGACGFATEAWQIGVLRFIASLGMGGEWSLGVALINEIWPDRSRAFLAGLIGAAANVGYLLIAAAGVGINQFVEETRGVLLAMGMSDDLVEHLLRNGGWRFLMMLGAVPALLTFFIRVYVPESPRWEQERAQGTTSHWATSDLLGVLVGALGACAIALVWVPDLAVPLPAQIAGTVLGFLIALWGYTYPVLKFFARSSGATVNIPTSVPEASAEIRAGQPVSSAFTAGQAVSPMHQAGPTFRRMLLAACLSGVALLGTWGSTQQMPAFTNRIVTHEETQRYQKEHGEAPTGDARTEIGKKAQIASSTAQGMGALGAVVFTILAALFAQQVGRRVSYVVLCVLSIIALPGFFLTRTTVDPLYYFLAFLVGGITAAFYGWLPLYLPELFRTSVRATGQGFAFNFGRVLAAIGVLQIGTLHGLFKSDDPSGGLGTVFASFALVYVVGMVIIWFVPETRGQPLPE